MSDAPSQNSEPQKLGRLATYGLLAATAVGGWYVGLPILAHAIPAIASHLFATAVVAAAGTTAAVVKKDKLAPVTNALKQVGSLYKQAFATVRADWKSALSWGKAKSAERQAEAAKTPANDTGASKLTNAAAKGPFNGVTAKAEAAAKPAEAKPAPKKAAGLGL